MMRSFGARPLILKMIPPYSNVLQNTFAMSANAMDTDQTAHQMLLREQSDLGPYCLQYGLPKYIIMREQMTAVISGG